MFAVRSKAQYKRSGTIPWKMWNPAGSRWSSLDNVVVENIDIKGVKYADFYTIEFDRANTYSDTIPALPQGR